MEPNLRMRADGTFTIVHFTDLHWQNGEKGDLRTRRLMADVLEAEKPDFVALTGDLIFGSRCRDPAESLRQAMAAVEQAGVPWAAVFGNHDDEGALGRAELMDVLRERPRCLSLSGPSDVDGIGNFALTLTNSRGMASHSLVFLDSGGRSSEDSLPGYDWIRPSQIEWYRRISRERADRNRGAALPSLLFFHIPFPEFEQVWKTQACYGTRNEKPACPPVNSGLYAALLERGGTLGVFCGHDHTNDYWGELGGIRLCYGRATGFQGYGKIGFPRGARVIRLQEGKAGFETWVRLENGSTIRKPKLHRPRRWP
ncbi:metallophosphoesterase family protein [Cohnella zeiphila]|uniref:Metallophosphoesterase family protein n=1 Tax=Cohnella zeiphila TaxID=2761120 RepID=A0A7X0SJT6_9BACL|nr:metallophosphoesterase family protein [Cohnella zeiphila]MBB6731282.1 metallophosphoesterase family protein [Cohnella zeiphila]